MELGRDAASPIKQLLRTTEPTNNLGNIRLGPFTWQTGWLRCLWANRDVEAIVITGDWKILSMWPLVTVAHLLRIPVACWTIGWHRPEFGTVDKIREKFYRRADSLLLYGHHAQCIALAKGFRAGELYVVGNSINAPTNIATVHPSERHNIIVVGRLTTAKKLHLLLEAVAALPCEARPSIKLIGVGEEEQRLRETSKDLNLDVEFPGEIHDVEDLEHHYQSARITVIPGAAGLSVIQSLAYGVPVITHSDLNRQMPEVEAIRQDWTGELVPYEDVNALGRAVERWLRMDDDEYAERSSECRKVYLNNWTPADHAAKIVRAIQGMRIKTPL